jgi:hypothetical protein
VYFGDAGSPGVLHSVGAHRAACAVITLDTPGMLLAAVHMVPLQPAATQGMHCVSAHCAGLRLM